MKEVKIIFDNEAAAHLFLTWLCNSGEQSYWDWVDGSGDDDADPATVNNFDYWGGTNDGKEFGKHPVVATCKKLGDK